MHTQPVRLMTRRERKVKHLGSFNTQESRVQILTHEFQHRVGDLSNVRLICFKQIESDVERIQNAAFQMPDAQYERPRRIVEPAGNPLPSWCKQPRVKRRMAPIEDFTELPAK